MSALIVKVSALADSGISRSIQSLGFDELLTMLLIQSKATVLSGDLLTSSTSNILVVCLAGNALV